MTSCFIAGKLIVCGEHGVVYGYPALVSTIGLGVRVEIEKTRESGVMLESKDLGLEWKGKVGGLVELLDRSRKMRSMYLSGENKKGLEELWKDRLLVMKLAVGVVVEKLGKDVGGRVVVKSNLPIGSGLGSSAAVAVAVISGLGEVLGLVFDRDKLFMMAMEVEKVLHGNPSGVDVKVVVERGLLKFKKKEGKIFHNGIKVEGKLPKVLLIQSGVPKESTGEMVGLVGERVNKFRGTGGVLEEIGVVTEKMEGLVKEGKLSVELIKENERLLEEIGVVGEAAKEIVKRVEAVGGAAKVSGAGGVKEGSGILIAWSEDMPKVMNLVKKEGWRYWETGLGE